MEQWLLPVEGGGGDDDAPTASPGNSAKPGLSVGVVLSTAPVAALTILNVA